MIKLRPPVKRNIVDNHKGNDLSLFLNNSISQSTDHISIATGFFNISGYALIKDSLRDALHDESRQLRLIIGREVFDEPKNRSFESLFAELEDSKYDEENKNHVDDLINFLGQKNVFVKSNEDKFTHAKCYIFDQHVVVGSSNLTSRGLQKSEELNAVLDQSSHMQEVKEWFDRVWNKGHDSKKELIEALDASKFGRPIEPYLMYMKMLYEYHRQKLEDIQRVDTTSNDLTDFQKHAVIHALRILRKYKGVIIADSTGLGKTPIGIEILKKKVGEERKKTLLIAPKQVLDSIWHYSLDNELIRVKEVSTEKTGTANFNAQQYVDDVQVIIIDESHNYRNGSTARYNNLMKILAGGKKKEVILLTATPVNNSLMDLYYQLNLITAGDDTYFSNLGIPNLHQHFSRADKKNMMVGIDSINNILYEIMIKRTRQSIRKNYPDSSILVGNIRKKVTFPERKLHKIEYSLTKVLGSTVYNKVLDLIDEINLVPYRIEYYSRQSDEEEKQAANNQVTLQKTFLMKRFESSVEAIRKSIQTLERFYMWFDLTLQNGEILDSVSFRKLLDEFPEDDVDEKQILERIQNDVKLISLDAYNKKAVISDVKSDLAKIRAVQKEFASMGTHVDSKLTALKDDFKKNKVFTTGSKKVVVFTAFIDTANYIYKDLRSELKEEVLIMTGDTSAQDREKILQQFAPKANNGKQIGDTPQVLISTDILSEGQNLQDCNYVINYDLPWNPMKIVQRVGRVDRLASEFESVTSAVFIPEKELDSVLKLLEKLQQKITKIGDSVGHEIPIFGEQARPKDFNAIEKIKHNDASLISDLEKSADMLSSEKPYDLLLRFIKEVGEDRLKRIPMGRRSGKSSSDSGLIISYQNKKTNDVHFTFYNYQTSTFEHIDDASWVFSRTDCNTEEPRSMPFADKEAFHQIVIINNKAKEKILANLSIGRDTRIAQDIGSKKQRTAKAIIEKAHQDGIISAADVGDVHTVLTKKNLSPWNYELDEFIHDYNNSGDITQFVNNLQILIATYKINTEPDRELEEIGESDLRMVGCMFLNGSKMKEPKLQL